MKLTVLTTVSLVMIIEYSKTKVFFENHANLRKKHQKSRKQLPTIFEKSLKIKRISSKIMEKSLTNH